jgi:hypothetical protein
MKEICLLWNLKVSYHIQKNQPLQPTPSQMNPVHILSTYYFKTLFNIIPYHLHQYGSSHQYSVCTSDFPHVRHTPHSSYHQNPFDLILLILFDQEYRHYYGASHYAAFPASCYVPSLRSKYSPRYIVHKHFYSYIWKVLGVAKYWQ